MLMAGPTFTNQESWMVTQQQQRVEKRHTPAGQELLTPVQLVQGTWPQY